MTWKTLTLFSNTWTAGHKYSRLSRDNLIQPNQMHLSQKQKTFYEYFWTFFNCTPNLERFETNMTFIAYVFRKVRTPKHVVR